MTRVGEGPFPTEQRNNIGERNLVDWVMNLALSQEEKRRCGWLDLVLLKQSVNIPGIKGIALTKLMS